jgi:iron complex outermembrane recepter protein
VFAGPALAQDKQVVQSTQSTRNAQVAQDTQTKQVGRNTQTAENTTDNLQLETVTVTGVKGFGTDVTQVGSFRGAKLVDTPMTVQVLPHDLLVSQQALNLNDALRNIAGVDNSQTSTVVTSGQSVRGIPLDNRNAYRMDGSLPVINLMDMPTEDKDRVELMKGASALYYGFASPAGVVNLTMKRPTADTMVAADVFGNEYGALGTHVDVGGTTDGGFGYRLNGLYTGVNPGIKGTVGTRSLFSGAFDYSPLQNVTMQLDLEYLFKSIPEPSIFRYATTPTSTLADPYPAITLPNIHAIDPKNNPGPYWTQYRADEENVLSHNVWNITNAWALTADYGDSRFARNRVFSTIQPINVTTGSGTEQFAYSIQQSENRNARLQVDGKLATWILVHNVSAGWSDNIRDTYSVTAPTTACAGGAYTVNCQTGITSVNGVAVNFLNPTFATLLARQATPIFTGPTTRVDDMGYYLFDRIEATDYVELLGGIRFGNYYEATIKPVQAQTFHAAPTSKAGSVVVKPLGDDELSIYGSYIEALETTAAAPVTANNYGFQPPPTPSFEREVGVKYQPWIGLLAQLSYFNIGRGNAVVDSNNNYGLNGRSKFDGFEASVTGDVTDDFSVAVSGMILMAKVVSGTATCGPGTAVGTLGGSCKTFTPTLIGLNVDNTAKSYGSVFARYKLGGLFSELEGLAVNGGLYYVGARYVDPLNEARISDYALIDLGVSYSTDAFAYPIVFRVNARNVGNRRYWAATDSNLLAAGQPADLEFSLETHF